MAQWINLNQNNRFVLANVSIFCIVRKNWPYLLLLVGLRQAGRKADEIRMGLESFKILYMLNYLSFYFVNITAVLLYTLLELHFSRLLSSKACFKVHFEVRKFQSPCQSLLLGTSVPNDTWKVLLQYDTLFYEYYRIAYCQGSPEIV